MTKKIINSYELRTKLEMSQKQFGEAIGVTRDTVALWESKNPERQTKPRQKHALKMLEIQREYQKDVEDENRSPIEVVIEKIVKEQIEKIILPLHEKIDSLSDIISKNQLKKLKKI